MATRVITVQNTGFSCRGFIIASSQLVEALSNLPESRPHPGWDRRAAPRQIAGMQTIAVGSFVRSRRPCATFRTFFNLSGNTRWPDSPDTVFPQPGCNETFHYSGPSCRGRRVLESPSTLDRFCGARDFTLQHRRSFNFNVNCGG